MLLRLLLARVRCPLVSHPPRALLLAASMAAGTRAAATRQVGLERASRALGIETEGRGKRQALATLCGASGRKMLRDAASRTACPCPFQAPLFLAVELGARPPQHLECWLAGCGTSEGRWPGWFAFAGDTVPRSSPLGDTVPRPRPPAASMPRI